MRTDRTQQQSVYHHLVAGYRAAEGRPAESRWRWLTAAHIVGQRDFRLHVHGHVLMLGLAVRTRDWPEAAGQLLRLSLVPVGHALGRLPAGNIGRATVSAFQPMPLDDAMRRLIADARRCAGAAAI